MHFHKEKGRQVLDMSGDMVLTFNKDLVSARSKSAAPQVVRRATYICDMGRLTLRGKIATSFRALAFIWGRGPRCASK